MIRTRIQLTEEQVRAIKTRARSEERLMAELVHERVVEYPARRPTPDRELARRVRGLEGRFRPGCADLAEEHDRYLDDVFGPRTSSSIPRRFLPSSMRISPGAPT